MCWWRTTGKKISLFRRKTLWEKQKNWRSNCGWKRRERKKSVAIVKVPRGTVLSCVIAVGNPCVISVGVYLHVVITVGIVFVPNN
jgi:hypothetical protein